MRFNIGQLLAGGHKQAASSAASSGRPVVGSRSRSVHVLRAICRCSAKFAQLRPHSGPNLTDVARVFTDFDPTSAYFGQIVLPLGSVWPNSARIWPIRPKSAKMMQVFTKLQPLWAKGGLIWPIRPNVALSFGQLWPASHSASWGRSRSGA